MLCEGQLCSHALLASSFCKARQGCNAGDIHAWDIGGYWALPLQWIQNALAINEFSAGRWQKPDPNPTGLQLGTAVLESYDFRHSRLWVWLCFAVVIAWILGLNVILVAAATLLPG